MRCRTQAQGRGGSEQEESLSYKSYLDSIKVSSRLNSQPYILQSKDVWNKTEQKGGGEGRSGRGQKQNHTSQESNQPTRAECKGFPRAFTYLPKKLAAWLQKTLTAQWIIRIVQCVNYMYTLFYILYTVLYVPSPLSYLNSW